MWWNVSYSRNWTSSSTDSSGLNGLDTLEWIAYHMRDSPFDWFGIHSSMEAPTLAMAALGILYVAVGILGKTVINWQRSTTENISTLQKLVGDLSKEVGAYRADTRDVIEFQREVRDDMKVLREHILFARRGNS